MSVHFNAYDGSAHGTEVLFVTQQNLATLMADAIAIAGDFTDRGAKYRSDLAFLNNTHQPDDSDRDLFLRSYRADLARTHPSVVGPCGRSWQDA